MNNYLEQKKNTHLYFQIGESQYAINTANVLEIMKSGKWDIDKMITDQYLLENLPEATMKDTQHSVALENEKKVLEEMFELEKKHFGELKKTVKIDVSL